MADHNEDYRPEDEEVQGGLVKSFLEHLEDLRWMLIKSGVAVLAAMLLCLYNLNWIMAVIKRPLEQANRIVLTTNQMVHVEFGTNIVGYFELQTNKMGAMDFGTQKNITLHMEPIMIGTQSVMGVTMSPADKNTPNGGQDIIYLDPAEPFLSGLQLAFYGGLLLASPFVFYFLGQFVMPALKIKEKKYFLRAFAIGLGLFLSGVCFSYFWIMPPALKFAEKFANWMGVKVPNWTADHYTSFVIKFMFGMGIGFELPVVLLALVKIGLLDYAKLSAMRRYMIVANLILGALLTTPEVFTQVVMAVILQLLYEASVWIAWYWEYKARKRAAEGKL